MIILATEKLFDLEQQRSIGFCELLRDQSLEEGRDDSQRNTDKTDRINFRQKQGDTCVLFAFRHKGLIISHA